jgi:hypothetical protein
MERTNLQKGQIDLIKESICVYTKCNECQNLYKSRKLCFAAIETLIDDRGKSCLFRLKEMCHELFRNSDVATYKEKLYDITVGYIFHEAMKLRENVYQLEYYKPQRDISSHEMTSLERKIVHEIESLVKKAEKRMKEGFKEVKTLLGELVGQLKDLIKLYRDNYLLPRFVYENRKVLTRIYGKKGCKELIQDIYPGGNTMLIERAAQSYLESQYYDQARVLFKRVHNLDSKNVRTIFFYMYTSAFHFHYKNMPSKALAFAEEGLSLRVDDDLKDFRESLKQLASEVHREVAKRRKTKGGKRYAHL